MYIAGFFFQAEDGIRVWSVTGVQTCALPILWRGQPGAGISGFFASCADSLISRGAGKSGNPCARLTAPYCIAWRVISRITDSVKCATLLLRNRSEERRVGNACTSLSTQNEHT